MNTEEKVTFVADSSEIERFLPLIHVSTKVGGASSPSSSRRAFRGKDMSRVLDYDALPDPPSDGPMLHCESAGTDGLKFPVRHFCLRGGFLFYFDVQDVDDEEASMSVTYHGPPLGVLPLEDITVEFPPGGRRVFREHAHTDARNGYELVIIHAPDEDNNSARPAEFLVAESLGQRERWATAIQQRSDHGKDTLLRPDPNATPHRNMAAAMAEAMAEEAGAMAAVTTSAADPEEEKAAPAPTPKQRRKPREPDVSGDSMSHATDMLDKEESDAAKAAKEFAVDSFVAQEWIDDFFRNHNDFDAPAKLRTLEQWQGSIKKGLKGAVLEQYEYFVEASGEMTTMGREVAALRALVESQVETIKEMKEIDFASAINEPSPNEMDMLSDDDSEALEPPRMGGKGGRRRRAPQPQDDDSDVSSVSSTGASGTRRRSVSGRKDTFGMEEDGTSIEFPSWLEDVSEEISAFIKECRYTDASELLFKAKAEVNAVLSEHEQPTEHQLTKKQHANIQSIQQSLEKLTERMSSRLVESLRRRNEALKQAAKRERSDPLSLMAPMVSPCCLNDDFIPLQLLVKLGKTQEAATAYAARRSLLLMEALHERPISGTGTVDLVIYSAQLSQSFFSCLASAVEGFLDLFLTVDTVFGRRSSNAKEENSLDESSMQSMASKNVAPGALAAIVLWCDSELSKFSSAFGGTRILGNLALSPPPRDMPRGPGQSSRFEDEGGNKENTKERQNAIEVAAQCVDQAFLYASQNLDSIGLPLTPRLAEYIRSRLKGCEGEVAELLSDRWRRLALDWELERDMDYDDQPMDERRGMGIGLRPSRSGG